MVRVPQEAAAEERVMEIALEAGADDVKVAGDRWEITCEPATMAGILEALQGAGLAVEPGGIVRLPSSTVTVEDVDVARKVLDLLERLDDHDDVQSVAANFSIPDEALAQLG
jgi:transcriptional/translational regulatory protein YebC/TACO1